MQQSVFFTANAAIWIALEFVVCVAFSSISAADEPVDFNRDIRPILSDKCFLCHGPDENDRQADLRLDLQSSAHEVAIVPGSLDDSELWQRITANDEDYVMPPVDSHKELTEKEVELIRRWILDGAKYLDHWAFRPIVRPNIPSVDDPRFTDNPIDAFTYRKMKTEGLAPSPEAARETLIRRVTFDLTGMPPTIDEIEAFLNDTSANAYEKLVDRLLASPRYGQRMALDWLDVARYGDTSVHHADGPRDMWKWRDWVVDAYNDNMRFNDFTIKQLAGDLLPDATLEDKIASGFNRNNASTDEGGAIAEEFRVEYAVDRVKTTSLVWLGLSMECAQCHDHKYDPISQEDYFRFFAFFNQAADPGMQTRQGNQKPVVDILDDSKMVRVPKVEAQISATNNRLEDIRSESMPDFRKWLVAAYQEQPAELDPPTDMLAYFPLDEASGDQVVDQVQAKTLGKLIGKFSLEIGRFGKALRTSNQVFVEAPPIGQSLERTDSFSYGCWIYFDKNPNGAPIARMDDQNRHRGFDLFISRGQLAAHIIHDWPGNAIKIKGPVKLKPKTWHHLFATYDGSSKAAGVRLFLDGKQIKTSPDQDGLTKTIRTQKPFTIGRRSPGSRFNGLVDEVKIFKRELTPHEVAQLADADPMRRLLAIDPYWRTAEQTDQLHALYLSREKEEFDPLQKKLAALEGQLTELQKPITSVMVMADVPEMRMTYVLDRGEYDSPDKKRPVEAGVPGFLPAFSSELPQNRLGMARWLISDDNPLTARVTANRIWKTFFGTGIVKTVEDFGSQGQWPSHPQLLDYLAYDFVENGWDVKRLVKLIVTSQTYRQSSRITDKLRQVDPENRLLARGSRFRLPGEFLRDQALFVSGLLNDQYGGPGVKPYQPPGLWNEVSLDGNLRFKQDAGDKLYRRSLYTYWKRSAPPPAMVLFDAPTREKCTVRRSITNTPLQALVLMNDPQFVEAARIFAERIIKDGGDSVDERINYAYRLATARIPDQRVIGVLRNSFEREQAVFADNPQRAEKLLATGEKPHDKSLDAAELAAWTIIASMILNLDETITRG